MFKLFSDALNLAAMAVAVVVIAFSAPLQSDNDFSERVAERAKAAA